MLSPRRSAQLGLSAASLTLVTSITVLFAGAADPSKVPAKPSPVITASQINPPVAAGEFVSAHSGHGQQVVLANP